MRPELDLVRGYADRYLDSLSARRVGSKASYEELVAALGSPLADDGVDAEA